MASVRINFGKRARPEMQMETDSGQWLYSCRVHLKKKFFECLWVDKRERMNKRKILWIDDC